jgi:hypothetical protein
VDATALARLGGAYLGTRELGNGRKAFHARRHDGLAGAQLRAAIVNTEHPKCPDVGPPPAGQSTGEKHSTARAHHGS